jgi:hypothetical protein
VKLAEHISYPEQAAIKVIRKAAKLLAPAPTPAKTFHRMWTRTRSVEALPWWVKAREAAVE